MNRIDKRKKKEKNYYKQNKLNWLNKNWKKNKRKS